MRQSALKMLSLLPAIARTTSATGAANDLQGYINPGGRAMKAYLEVGDITTAGSLAVKIQESDTTTAADFGDITGAAFTSLTTAGNTEATNEEIHFVATKRYVRALATAGSGAGHTYAVLLLAEQRQV